MKKIIQKSSILLMLTLANIANAQQLLTNKVLNKNGHSAVEESKDLFKSYQSLNSSKEKKEKIQGKRSKISELKTTSGGLTMDKINEMDLVKDNKFIQDFIKKVSENKEKLVISETDMLNLILDVIDKKLAEEEATVDEEDKDTVFKCDTCAPPDDNDCVKIVGGASLNDLGSVSSSKGSMSFGAFFNFGKKSNSSLYMFFNTKPSSSSDSASVGKTFIFPELSSRDYIIGYMYNHDLGRNWNLIPFLELSLCQHSNIIDTTKTAVNFNSSQLIIGLRFSKSYYYNINAKPHTVGFTLIPYMQGISVNAKYADPYRKTLNGFSQLNGGEKNLPLNILAGGVRGQIDFEDFSFFCNMKFPINTSKTGGINSDLKQFVYTIGIAITPKIIGI